MKAIVILVDGMRPDSLTDVKEAQELLQKSTHTLRARTVMPSVTLPCHMSLFHSVDPARHGTTTNIYAPQVRPIDGLCEVLRAHKKTCAFFYNWEELRDLTRPGALAYSYFCSGHDAGYTAANEAVASNAIEYLTHNGTDFAFIYLGEVDEIGHKHGWMSEEYLAAVQRSWVLIDKIVKSVDEETAVIITADHGGHDRIHGTEEPEDMTTPLLLYGTPFAAGQELTAASIKDIAPTVTKLLGVEPSDEWEGSPLC